MAEAVERVEEALRILKKDPWGPDVKASDDFFEPVFKVFFEKLHLPNLVPKSDYHELALFLPDEALDEEVRSVLDDILDVARRARGLGGM